MRRGTKSLLFGVHQFIWHPITVWIAWVVLYRQLPGWRECFCIVIHDLGYWGCPGMDCAKGKLHPELAGRIAGKLLGPAWGDFCRYHSKSYARLRGAQPSKLCYADKLAVCFDWWPFYRFRAALTGELAEYREQAALHGFIPEMAPHWAWMRKLRAHERAKMPDYRREFA